ncbi:MAG: hypothetical protein GXO84_10125 [Chlorobi bacterium]|nr:hypothetical protein [Chlorobiota bacterium]
MIKRVYIATIISFTLINCQTKKYEKYDYYESGEVKEKFLFDNKSDYESNLNYTGYLYYKNGQIKDITRVKNGERVGTYVQFYENGNKKRYIHYKQGKKYGFDRFYSPDNELVMENVYINDVHMCKMKSFSNKDKTSNFYYYVEPDSLIENGVITYDTNNNLLPNESFYFNIFGDDTIYTNENYNFSCKVYTLGAMNIIDSLIIGEFNEKYEFINFNDTVKIKPKSDSVSLSIKPNYLRENLIMGKIYISSYLSPNEKKYTREFIFYKDFFVKTAPSNVSTNSSSFER